MFPHHGLEESKASESFPGASEPVKKKLKLFTDFELLRGKLSLAAIEPTENVEEADILWITASVFTNKKLSFVHNSIDPSSLLTNSHMKNRFCIKGI